MKSCRKIGSDVVPPSECHTPQAGRSSKKRVGTFVAAGFTKVTESLRNGVRSSKTPPRQRTPDVSFDPSNSSLSYQWNSGTAGIRLPLHYAKQETRYQPASGTSHGDRNPSREVPDPGYQTRPPPPGSYQDDDTGPSPKNLLMAVMGVKSAVNHFAKALISDINKHPEQLKYLKKTIIHQVPTEVDRANHWKFLVQAFICKRLFEGFEAENGFFGIPYFDELKMTSSNSFADFSKFKDKAATMSGLLERDSQDISFLGKFCFMKFKSITRNLYSNQPFPLYQQDWNMVESERHPQSEFYQRFLQVAVSVWLLHRLVHSFEQDWRMLGWETFPQGCEFQRENMESVVPGGFEDEDEQSSSSANDMTTIVGFLVIPGFQVSKSVVKCEVYLRNVKNRSFKDGKIVDATEVSSSVEKPSTDKTPPGSYRTASYRTASYRTTDSHSGPITMGEEALSNIRSHSRESGGNSSSYNRIGQGLSPGGSKNGRNDRGHMSTNYFLEAPPAVVAKQPVTRHTKLSQQREAMNRRTH